jgi:hypothetical protein
MKRFAAMLLALGTFGSMVLGAPAPEPAAAKAAAPAAATPALAAVSTLADLPIKEVTVFKDGHAFVLHEGKVAVDAAGGVTLDYLPAPILGSFWPYSSDPKVKLAGVTAGKRRVSIDRTALSIPELIEGNVGAKVRIRLAPLSEKEEPMAFDGVIVGIPTRNGDELRRTGAPGAEERLPQKSDLVLIKTDVGVRTVPVAKIAELTFLGDPKPSVSAEEFRNILAMKFDWPEGKAGKTAAVGMGYLQRGIRWIPEYRIEIDGKGRAQIKLQATLINELADLSDVKAHLVVGVPSFAFKEMADPMALQQAVAQLSSQFRADASTAYALSNAMMTQVASPVREAPVPAAAKAMDLGPEVSGGQKSEDLYIFTVEHITLKKGERMVVSVGEYALPYRDLFTLALPFGPPRDVRQNFGTQQQLELVRLMTAPKAKHILRLQNKAEMPLTTAPAMILKDGRVLAQGMMKYTPVGAAVDLEIGTAIDIVVTKTEKETGRTPNVLSWRNTVLGRIDMEGQVHLANLRSSASEIEVTRYVMGLVDSAEQQGKIEQLNGWESALAANMELPAWWGWYNWPYWWYEFNGIGSVKWTVNLDAGKEANLDSKWHFFW